MLDPIYKLLVTHKSAVTVGAAGDLRDTDRAEEKFGGSLDTGAPIL